MKTLYAVFLIALLVTPWLVCWPVEAKTRLPLPRYVSVNTSEANVRTGPGLRYRIKWVLQRKGMPLEIIAEFEQWRKIRDIQGDEGWMHRSQLSNNRTVTIVGETQILRERISAQSHPVARIEAGAHAELEKCRDNACLITADNLRGWVPRSSLWGVYPNETLD